MPLTLGLTGMDPATETALKAAFLDASARAGGVWTLVPESEATHVMVDMDSMYGPMSWLRLHAGGKRVIGLTTAPRTQTDFRLGRPFDSEGFADLLRTIAIDSGVEVTAQRAPAGTTVEQPLETGAHSRPPARDATHPQASAAAPPAPVPLSPAAPSGMTEAPVPDDVLHADIAPAPGDDATPDVTEAAPAAAAPTPAATLPAAPPAPRVLGLAAWLAADGLSRRVRYRRQTGPTLLIDPATRRYHGPSTLKPISPYFLDGIAEQDFEPLDDVTWARESAAAGAAQPLQRLEWLGALVAGRDDLAADAAGGTRFRLNKWPQTEREYPKHFRIATAMMKGPATLAEIADASGMPELEVREFVNASLATGFADRVVEETASDAPEPAPRSGGLLGRLRGR